MVYDVRETSALRGPCAVALKPLASGYTLDSTVGVCRVGTPVTCSLSRYGGLEKGRSEIVWGPAGVIRRAG